MSLQLPLIPVDHLRVPRPAGRPGHGAGRRGGADTGPYRLVRARPAAASAPVLDATQAQVAAHAAGPLLVLAGPGTGKTTALVEAAVARVEAGADPASVLLLTFGRRAAGDLRERITARLGRTTVEPLARTFHSYAFGLLRRDTAERGEPPPRLLSGAEQDVMIRELLEGDEKGDGVHWPADRQAALGAKRGFTAELRDLLLRALERRVDPVALDRFGRKHGRDDWRAAARFLQQYLDVQELRDAQTAGQGVGHDTALIISDAIALLEQRPAVLAAERAARAYVFVDEYQDTDPEQRRLLSLLCGEGRFLVAAADPDQSIFAFRGADPTGVRTFVDDFPTVTGEPAPAVVLGTCHRAGPTRTAGGRVAVRLRGPGRHRAVLLPTAPTSATPAASATSAALATEGVPAADVEVAVLRSAAQEASYVAARLRRAHLLDHVPWSRMAVIVRSTDRHLPAVRRALLHAGVPVSVAGEDLPVPRQPRIAPLLQAVRCALGIDPLDEAAAVALLQSPLGDADALDLRRLRQQLRMLAQAAGDTRPSGALLAEALLDPVELIAVEARWARPATRVAAVLTAARIAAGVAGASPEDVLWAAWEASRLGPRWQAESGGGGVTGAAADRDLDAAVTLFESAATFTDRVPGATPALFLDHLGRQQIAADSIAPTADRGEVVRVLTAHAAKGREWDVVAVAGVQEGLWPDLQLRGTVLGSEELVDLVAKREPDRSAQLSALLDEERRLFYVAVTRARKALLVTAVDAGDGDDEQPSRFLDELDPTEPDREPAAVPRTLSLPALVAELRTVVTARDGDPVRRRAAAYRLAALAAAGVPGADPEQWWGFAPLSDAQPLRRPGEAVPVSPSKIEQYETCALRWVLEASGGGTTGTAQGVGSVVHDVAADVAEEAAAAGGPVDLAALNVRLSERWRRVDLSGWYGRQQRERAAKMVARLAGWLAENPRSLVAVEREFAVEVGRATLRGRVDRLERDDAGRLVVVDLKTGTGKPAADTIPEHPQLAAYQVAVERGAFADEGTESGGASLVQIGGTTAKAAEQPQPPLAGQPDPGWAASLVEAVAEGMAGSAFTATANDYCRLCPVSSSCPIQSGQVTG